MASYCVCIISKTRANSAKVKSFLESSHLIYYKIVERSIAKRKKYFFVELCNDWNHVAAASVVKGSIKNVTHEEMAIAIQVMKPGKAAGPSEVCAEMISVSGQVGVSVIMELCQRV